MRADEVKRLRLLEQENARLTKLLTERYLEVEIEKEINAKNGERKRPFALKEMMPTIAVPARLTYRKRTRREGNQ